MEHRSWLETGVMQAPQTKCFGFRVLSLEAGFHTIPTTWYVGLVVADNQISWT